MKCTISGIIRQLVSLLIICSFFQILLGNPLNNIAYIDADCTFQIIRGFGAANILPWRPDMTDEEIEKAFGTGDGQLGFTILRIRVPNDSNDFYLNIKTAKAAYNMGVKIIASPWSPPAYMKSNNNIVGGRLLEEYYDDFARYLKSFAEYMADNGAPLYAISLQNEPDWHPNYESCDWTGEEMAKFLKENGHIIRSIGVKIMAPESYQFRREMSDPILNDSAACANLDILAGHIYGGGVAPYPLAEEKGKEIWMTEYLINSGNPPGDARLDTGWTGAMRTAISIQKCMNVNMSAYVWWYIVRYYGPISDGTFVKRGQITKKGYVMSQFSRFIRPGYRRIYSTFTPQRDIYITAYKGDSTDNRIVIVAINNSYVDKEQTFIVRNESVYGFIPYTTSSNKNCEKGEGIIVNDSSFTATLKASSITTFISSNKIENILTEERNTVKKFQLYQNYPNPFNSITKIKYSIFEKSYVSIKLYNLLGKEIYTLFKGIKKPGTYEVYLDGSNLKSGLYIYTLESNGRKASKKLLLIK